MILFGISSHPPKQVIGIVFPHPSSNSNATFTSTEYPRLNAPVISATLLHDGILGSAVGVVSLYPL